MICINDGFKIGFVDDLEIDTVTYQMKTLISYGKGRFFGLLGGRCDVRIDCKDVQVIGEDIILVSHYQREGKSASSPRRNPSGKESFWSRLFE